MSESRIAFDIDDVLAGTTDALRVFVNEQTGLNLGPEEYKVPATYWGYYEHVWKTAGLNEVQGHDFMKRFHENMGMEQDNIVPLPGSAEILMRLAENHDIVAVTSRELFMEEATKRWVHQHFGNVFSQIMLLGHIHSAKQTKGDACLELEARLLVDDNLGHCQSAEAVGIEAVLFGEYGWHNEHADVFIPRCPDMMAVERYIDEHCN